MENMKITLVRTGGTIGCARGENGVLAPAAVDVPYLDDFDVRAVTPFYELSERLNCSHYALLLQELRQALPNSDGIVVTHGTDTLPFTAAVAAFALGKADIPVVFVSSNKPLSDADASGHRSLQTAAAFLRTNSCGVFVADGTLVHSAVRLLEARAFDGQYFSALDAVCARAADGQVQIIDLPKQRETPPLDNLCGKDIVCVKPYPNMNYDRIETAGAACVLHDTYHSGTADEIALNRFARRCRCPVYLTGGSKGMVYASKAGFAENLRVYDNVTFAAMYAKLLIGLNRYGKNDEELTAYLKENQCGEFF